MDNFVTWADMLVFGTLITINFAVVEFIKELPFINKLKTKYLSWLVAFSLITITNIATDVFAYKDIVLYAISSIFIALSANGMSDFNNFVDKTQKDK